MKTINRLFAAALVLFVAAACYNKEIESPDNRQDPETQDISEQTGLKITASIIQTRVTYTDGTTTLNQQWEKGENGDIVFGFIDDANHTPVVLQVDDINNGVATLVPTTGGDALSAMEENTYVNLIYTGGSPQSLVASDETYSYSIDMTDQDGKIPACMHARARKEGNAIEFDFVNDCAIFEIVSLTGVAEDHSSDSQDLESITVSNVFTSGKYTFDNGSVSFAGDGTVGDVTITLGNDWTVDDSGTIKNDGAAQPVLIAVAPKTADENASITITAEADNNIHYGYDFGSKSIEDKKCYVVSAKPVVAKTTTDGQYFTSISAAFAHARTIAGTTGTEVKLLKSYISGLMEKDATHDATKDPMTRISIDYPVTFDLNGCILDLDFDEENDAYNRGGFIVSGTDGHLILEDSAGGGCIQSASYCPLINNIDGTVDIQGGVLYFWENVELDEDDPPYIYSPVIKNTSELNVSGGSLYCFYGPAIENSGANAEVTITGGVIGNESYFYEALQVLGGTNCTISGGVIYSLGQQACAIGCRSTDDGDPVLTVEWPKESDGSSYEPIIYSAGVYTTTLPISAFMGGANKADIIINGGYLISNNTYGAFYCDCDYEDEDSNLNLNLKESDTGFNFGGFYSNMSYVIMDGSNPSGSVRDLSDEGGKGLPDDSGQTFKAIPQNNTSLISAIIKILEDETEEEVEIDGLFLINAVTSISE